MHSLKVLKKRHTLREALRRAVGFKVPLIRSDERLFTTYAEAAENLDEIGTGLRNLCRTYLDFDFTPPEVAGFGARAAAFPFNATAEAMEARLQEAIDELATALDVPQLGRIEWTDDESCHFTFFEVERDHGVFRNTVRRVAHTHDLVKARMHRLPADDVTKPVTAQKILRAIPAPLGPFTRIVTGLEVLKDVREHSRREELTMLGKSVEKSKQGLRDFGNGVAAGVSAAAAKAQEVVNSEGFRQNAPKVAAGAGLAALGGLLVAGLVKVASLATVPLAVADPAIVIGELCLFGWDE